MTKEPAVEDPREDRRTDRTFRLRSDCRYSLLVPTSMGIRFTPADRQPVGAGGPLMMQATSAETNAASVSARLGLPVKVLTAFVSGSPIARYIQDNLASRRMDYEGPEVNQGGPWGHRHQFNFTDSGYGVRGPRVFSDRAGEVGRTLSAGNFDLARLFGEEGAQVVHFSGLIAALSPETGALCLELAREAKRQATLVSFDLNFRRTFWEGREEELRELFTEVAAASDILVGNEEDFQLCLGFPGPDARDKDLSERVEEFQEMIERVREAFPSVTVLVATLRQVTSATRHQWGAVLSVGGQWHIEQPREIDVLDRIGGGDGFAGGLLYGVLRRMKPANWVRFGWAAGALAVSVLTDYSEPMDEEEVWRIWEANSRVMR